MSTNTAIDTTQTGPRTATANRKTALPITQDWGALARAEIEREGRPDVPKISPWCMSPFKRMMDLVLVAPVLLLLSPVLLVVALVVRLTSPGPVLFRQERTGLHRRTFTIYKFRTMYHDRAEDGPCVTKTGDPRLTPVGPFLRKYKLDELPQLFNVLRGDMSLVGPRPKLPQHEHLDMYYRPGVTGAATLAFAKEEEMLHGVPVHLLEEFHVTVVSPIKKMLDREYMERATPLSDLKMLVDTLFGRQEQDLESVYQRAVQIDHQATLLSAHKSGD